MNSLRLDTDDFPEEIPDAEPETVDSRDIHWELRRGDICPLCGQSKLDYDGLLNLACSVCGYAVGGCFT